MNSVVSSVLMYPGSLLRSGIKSTTKVFKRILGRGKDNSQSISGVASVNTVASTKISDDGRCKPVAIQEC